MWRDEAYLLDMLLAARKVRQFSQGVTWERFQADELMQNAMMMCVQQIGEAARKVSREFQEAHPEIPWREIVGMRHRLVHDYFHIIPEKVWEVVERDVPALIPLIEPLVPPQEDGSPGGR